jgi:hypothetical protein
MKLSLLSVLVAAVVSSSVEAFAPSIVASSKSSSSKLHAKYNSMDEILALFPEEIPVLINFYDAKTEAQIKVG